MPVLRGLLVCRYCSPDDILASTSCAYRKLHEIRALPGPQPSAPDLRKPFPVNFRKFPAPAPKIPCSKIGGFIDEAPKLKLLAQLQRRLRSEPGKIPC